MDEGTAIAGLERTEAKLGAYAQRHGLVVRPELIWPGQPLPHEQRGPVRVYMSLPQGSGGWASGAGLERFCARAVAIADAIG